MKESFIKRQIIIGDTHGCIAELIALLDKIHFRADKDQIIFLGDLIDRGDNSYEVYMFVRNLKELMGDRCVIIRGNHEDMMLNDKRNWMHNGAQATIDSFEEHGCPLEEYKDFILKNSVMYYKDENIQCCHAGLSNCEIEEENDYELIWNRFYFMYAEYCGPITIIGHTPIDDPIVTWGDNERNRRYRTYKYGKKYDLPTVGLLNIDTGCVFGERLTAMIYYPEENKFVLRNVKKNLWTNTKIKSCK